MVSIYALGGVSGANFNPAVSFSLGLSGKMPFREVPVYAFVQILGGVLAGFSFHYFDGKGQKPFLLGPGDGFNWFHVLMVEALYTCMLCFVVLNCACARKNAGNEFYGIAIGFVIVAGGYAVGGISGGAFNPAVAFGIEISSGSFGWGYLYTIFALLGGAMAAALFYGVRPDDQQGQGREGEDFEYKLPTRLLAEFIGTFFLCLTVGFCVLQKSPATPWSAAAALMCMIFSLGNVSGANFNPAVTLALVLRGAGGMKERAIPYMVAQLIGSVGAAVVVRATHHNGTYGFGPPTPAKPDSFGWGPIAAAEIAFTFVLCFVVLCVCTTATPLKQFYGLAIGSCVTAGGFAVGAVSGGALNPAVALGATLVHMDHGGELVNGLSFASLGLLGGALAAVAFRATHDVKDKS